MDYRTLPIFQKGLHEYIYTKYYSLHGNEYLKCRWAEYKKHCEDRVIAPFQFIDIRDYHFVNCRNRFLPSESINNKTTFRMRLKPGPGVDFRGQLPIPDELMMKRSGNTQKEHQKLSRATKNADKETKTEDEDDETAK